MNKSEIIADFLCNVLEDAYLFNPQAETFCNGNVILAAAQSMASGAQMDVLEARQIIEAYLALDPVYRLGLGLSNPKVFHDWIEGVPHG